jgi:hypothetical protein
MFSNGKFYKGSDHIIVTQHPSDHTLFRFKK